MLLLDEPTNNLDVEARRRLYDTLEECTGCLLVVSHDRILLDRMAELYRGEIEFYGGNFAAYQETVAAGQRAAEGNVRNAEQQLKRQKRQMQEARERAARRAGSAARSVKYAGLPRIVAGKLKRDAQESAARSDEMHAARVGDARARLDDAERALRDDEAIVLNLPDTTVPAGRTLFAGERLRDGRKLFAGNGIDLTIRGPQRIALTGPNGAGKSTLLRIIDGDLAPEAGTVTRADGRMAYLSQRLDLLDPQRSLAESLTVFAPSLSHTRRMHLLAQFLFSGNRIHLPIGALSGGERLRATLAACSTPNPHPNCCCSMNRPTICEVSPS